mmetsp:Transcript_77857/g.143049  ORF Transcript_77857/g.143049 Transcript_77857/m.143049 type:complete len:273 (+) Transcript_77857:51-869(+)
MAEEPKRPSRSFFLYLEEHKDEFVKKAATYSQGISQAAKAWKSLLDKERLPFETRAKKLKEQYDKDLAAFLEAGGVKKGKVFKKDKGGKCTRRKKDANAPKKPTGGAYGCFLAASRATIKTSLPAGHSMLDITKKAGLMWKDLPANEKKNFESEYAKKAEEYKAAMEAYKKNKPGNGGGRGRGKEEDDDHHAEEEEKDVFEGEEEENEDDDHHAEEEEEEGEKEQEEEGAEVRKRIKVREDEVLDDDDVLIEAMGLLLEEQPVQKKARQSGA